MKQLSIIIYNVVHFLDLCLDSVFGAIKNLDAEVIVVDNASSDGSCEMIKLKYPEVKLLANTDNVGFAKANNQGVKEAKGAYVCILNPDTVVGESVFENVYAFAKANPKTGAIGVKLVDGTGTFLPESKRNLPTPKVAFQKLFGKANGYYATHLASEGSGEVQILVGAFMFMARAIYMEAGGFDERYFMYGEDIDLSYSIEQLGYKNYYLGEETVIHFKGESTAKDEVYRKRFYNAMRLFYNKYFEANFFQNTMVKIGLLVVRLSPRKRKVVENETPQAYLLVSSDKELVKKLENSIESDVLLDDKIEKGFKGLEVIFDTHQVTYKGIINALLHWQDQGMTFKFIPKKSTFALGSNSSTGRGSTLHW